MRNPIVQQVGGYTYHLVEKPDGTKIRHRLDGPAVICPSGTTFWYKNGKLHRDSGPAVEYYSGAYEYWHAGKLHRTNGPAVMSIYLPDTSEYEWYLNGKLHRLDGPAYETDSVRHRTRTKRWYVNGRRYSTEAEHAQAVAAWLSYREVTTEDIRQLIGDFRIVDWE